VSTHRSRTKNLMWYGVLGGKEILQKTFKNLDQRVQLECDGQRIPLPSLQGIVILNIPSFGGGSNFWGGTKEVDVSKTSLPFHYLMIRVLGGWMDELDWMRWICLSFKHLSRVKIYHNKIVAKNV